MLSLKGCIRRLASATESRKYDAMKQTAADAPLYARIASVLRQRIENSELAVGTMLPTLESYMSEFDASRVTLRLAMDMLASEGLIVRRRGFGTTVIAQPRTTREIQLPMTWPELLARLDHVKRTHVSTSLDEMPTLDALNNGDSHEWRPDWLPTKIVPRARAKKTNLVGVERQTYARIQALHHHGDIAYCVVNAWIDRRIYDASKRALRTRPALIVLMESHASEVNKVTQTLTLGIADVDVVSALGVPFGSPIAIVRRTVFNDAGERVYAAQIYFPASVVRIDTLLYDR